MLYCGSVGSTNRKKKLQKVSVCFKRLVRAYSTEMAFYERGKPVRLSSAVPVLVSVDHCNGNVKLRATLAAMWRNMMTYVNANQLPPDMHLHLARTAAFLANKPSPPEFQTYGEVAALEHLQKALVAFYYITELYNGEAYDAARLDPLNGLDLSDDEREVRCVDAAMAHGAAARAAFEASAAAEKRPRNAEPLELCAAKAAASAEYGANKTQSYRHGRMRLLLWICTLVATSCPSEMLDCGETTVPQTLTAATELHTARERRDTGPLVPSEAAPADKTTASTAAIKSTTKAHTDRTSGYSLLHPSVLHYNKIFFAATVTHTGPTTSTDFVCLTNETHIATAARAKDGANKINEAAVAVASNNSDGTTPSAISSFTWQISQRHATFPSSTRSPRNPPVTSTLLVMAAVYGSTGASSRGGGNAEHAPGRGGSRQAQRRRSGWRGRPPANRGRLCGSNRRGQRWRGDRAGRPPARGGERPRRPRAGGTGPANGPGCSGILRCSCPSPRLAMHSPQSELPRAVGMAPEIALAPSSRASPGGQ